jgi:DNA-binding protein Fis
MGGQSASSADKITKTITNTSTKTSVADSYNQYYAGLQGQDLANIVDFQSQSLGDILNTFGVFAQGALLNQNQANQGAIVSINNAQEQNLQTLSASQTIAQQTALNLVHEFTGLLAGNANTAPASVVPTNIMSSLPTIQSSDGSSSTTTDKTMQYAALAIGAIGLAILAFKKG